MIGKNGKLGFEASASGRELVFLTSEIKVEIRPSLPRVDIMGDQDVIEWKQVLSLQKLANLVGTRQNNRRWGNSVVRVR
jgi:hypothetical protein